MTNSISTIFTLDIYKTVINPKASQGQQVLVGRVMALLSMLIAALVCRPLLGELEQAFQYIQEFTGFFTPGIVAIFLLGFFWKRATAHSALAAAIASAVLSLLFKLLWPALPFMDRIGLVFVLCVAIAVCVTLLENSDEQTNAIDLKEVEYNTSRGFNLSALAITLILIGFYTTWW
jgi:SSS family solute:Na+ symporter